MHVPASVLVFGRDSQLVSTRRLILEKEGFQVCIASSLEDIQKLPTERTMDVMILCHTLSTEECNEALLLTHNRWPQIQTVALVTGSSSFGPNTADDIIEASEGPAKLIKAIRKYIN